MAIPGPVRALSYRPMIGRADSLSELTSSLSSPGIVIVSGPPGVGKTRLCAEAARLESERGRPVKWIDLNRTADQWLRQVARTIVSSMAVDLPDSSLGPLISSALAALDRPLVVLDNFDHLVAAASSVEDMADLLDDTTVLIASRVTLPNQGRLRTLRLEPMGAKDSLLHLRERLGEHLDPALAESLTRITCGLPLANEAAADAIEMLGPDEGLKSLEHRRETPLEALSQVIATSLTLVAEEDVPALVGASLWQHGFEIPELATALGVADTAIRLTVARLVRLSLMHRTHDDRFELYPFVSPVVLQMFPHIARRLLTSRMAWLAEQVIRPETEAIPPYLARLAEHEFLLDHTLGLATTLLEPRDPNAAAVVGPLVGAYGELVYQRKPSPNQLTLFRTLAEQHPVPEVLVALFELLRQSTEYGEVCERAAALNVEVVGEYGARMKLVIANAYYNTYRYGEAEELIRTAENLIDLRAPDNPRSHQLRSRLALSWAHLALVRGDNETSEEKALEAIQEALECSAPFETIAATVALMLASLSLSKFEQAIEASRRIAHTFSEPRGLLSATQTVNAYLCAGKFRDAHALASDTYAQLRPNYFGRWVSEVVRAYMLTAIATNDIATLRRVLDGELERLSKEGADVGAFATFQVRSFMALAAFVVGDSSIARSMYALATEVAEPQLAAGGNRFTQEINAYMAAEIGFTIGERTETPPPNPPKSYVLISVLNVCRLIRERVVLKASSRTFRFTIGEHVSDLRSKPTLWSLLMVLAEARRARPGTPLSATELFKEAWFGVKATPKSADERVRAAIHKLREQGLREHLRFENNGYFLAPSLGLEIS